MKVLCIQAGQRIRLDGPGTVKVLRLERSRVTLGVDAPLSTKIVLIKGNEDGDGGTAESKAGQACEH